MSAKRPANKSNTTKAKTRQAKTGKSGKLKARHGKLARAVIGLVVVVIAACVAFQASPWPSSLLIRYAFDKEGRKTAQEMQQYVPAGVASVTNVQYRSNDPDAYLDAYYPASAVTSKQQLPTIVWVHGGGWVSGSKENVANYAKILASHGYTTVAIDYSIAPEAHYPLPVIQTNAALRYLQANAVRLHIDSSRFILAGDSAGSQIAAQTATIITNPAYARQMNMTAPIAPGQLRGMLLNCGAYDIGLTQNDKAARSFVHTVLWAYSGQKDYLHDGDLQYASVANYVTAGFPPSFITAGNADPLEPQSKELAARLTKLNVPADTLFYPENHQPRLQHEYQFHLDLPDAQTALSRMVVFLEQYTQP